MYHYLTDGLTEDQKVWTFLEECNR